jgi:uncharacterized membrane protein
MAENKNEQFVWAVFENFDLADDAAKQLEKWDKALADIQLGSMGIIQMTNHGKVKVHNYGPRNTRRGAKVGMVLGILAALLPAVTLVSGLVAGGILGGVAGSLSRKGLGLTDEDMIRVKKELESGKAILIVACDPSEMESTEVELERLGGTIEEYTLSSQDLEESARELSVPVTGDPSEASTGKSS